METTTLPKRLTRQEASEYLKAVHGIRRSRNTLARIAYKGGPKFIKAGTTQALYAPEDLDAWATKIISSCTEGVPPNPT